MQRPEQARMSVQGTTTRFQDRKAKHEIHSNNQATASLNTVPMRDMRLDSSSTRQYNSPPTHTPTHEFASSASPSSGKKTTSWWRSLLNKGDKRGAPSSATAKRTSIETASSTTLVGAEERKRPAQQQARKSKDGVYGAAYTSNRGYSADVKSQQRTAPVQKKVTPKSYKSVVQAPAPQTQPNTPSASAKKPGDDVERNTRHSDVVELLSGRKVLCPQFSNRYKLGEVLGDGAFGFVMTAYDKLEHNEVAVKFIIKSKIPKDLWNREKSLPVEIAILKSLSHPNIIRYIEHIVEDKYILLITELHGTEWSVHNPKLNPLKNPGLRHTPRGKAAPTPDSKMECSPLFRLTEEQEKAIKRRTSCDLFECIDARTSLSLHFVDKTISEENCKKIIAQIALAVKYMKDAGIVHRDLKDENVVIDENYNIKIVDLGSASRIPTEKSQYFSKFNGTAHFASPEIAKGNAYRGPEAEVWTMGVLLFTIVCGENPFQNRQEIIQGDYRFPNKVSLGCEDLVNKMLCYSISKRITAEGVLNHGWLRGQVVALRNEYAAQGYGEV